MRMSKEYHELMDRRIIERFIDWSVPQHELVWRPSWFTEAIPTDAIPTRLFSKYQVLYARLGI